MNFSIAVLEPLRPVDDRVAMRLNRAELLMAAQGTLFGPDAPRLPGPPLLAFDRVWDLCTIGTDGSHGGGSASIDLVNLGWIFSCHFDGDPVMPGSLIVDGLLQLVGLYAAMQGFRGQGRAIRVGTTRFRREVTPHCGALDYRIDVLRSSRERQAVLARGTAWVNREICVEVESLLVMIRDR